MLRGDPNFKPEKLTAYETGGRFTARANVSLEASVSFNEYDQLRSQEPTTLVTLANLYDGRAQPSLEYDVKAALLLDFARFIEWPESAFASARAPIEVCVVASNPFGGALARMLEGETVGNRTLIMREVRTASQRAGCHLLFVPAGTESRAAHC